MAEISDEIYAVDFFRKNQDHVSSVILFTCFKNFLDTCCNEHGHKSKKYLFSKIQKFIINSNDVKIDEKYILTMKKHILSLCGEKVYV